MGGGHSPSQAGAGLGLVPGAAAAPAGNTAEVTPEDSHQASSDHQPATSTVFLTVTGLTLRKKAEANIENL